MLTTQIGLPKIQSEQTAEHLNKLLANFQIHYQNLRGLHWNLRGQDFFELHVKFEEFYNDAHLKIDLIAERVLTMGYKPMHTFNAYLENAKIIPAQDVAKGKEGVILVVGGLQTLLGLEREILSLASDINDDGTADMMTQFIAQQEKVIWMLNAWLG
jgi:DNA-binding ferritin-like protein (oxidative damage protectant)